MFIIESENCQKVENEYVSGSLSGVSSHMAPTMLQQPTIGCGSSDTNLLTGDYLFTFLVQSINYYSNIGSLTGGLLHCVRLYHRVSESYDVVAPDSDDALSFVCGGLNICC